VDVIQQLGKVVEEENQQIDKRNSEALQNNEEVIKLFKALGQSLEPLVKRGHDLLRPTGASLSLTINATSVSIRLVETGAFASLFLKTKWDIVLRSGAPLADKADQQRQEAIGYRIEEYEHAVLDLDPVVKDVREFSLNDDDVLSCLATAIGTKIAHYVHEHKDVERRRHLPCGLWAFVAAALPFVSVLPFALLSYLGTGHPFWSLATGVVLLIIALGGLSQVRDESRLASLDPVIPSSFWFSISVSVTSMLLLALIGAELSLLLNAEGLAAFGHKPDVVVTYPRLVGTYLWFIADTIPLIKPDHTFGMAAPVLQPDGLIAGIPIALYQLVLAIYIVTFVRQLWVAFARQSEIRFRNALGSKAPAEAERQLAKAGGVTT
jgi:hypothetical protein